MIDKLDALWNSVSLSQRILFPVVAVMLVAVLAVQTWTYETTRQIEEGLASDRLEADERLFQELLRPLGSEWRLENGRLSLGGIVMNDHNDAVDAFGRISGGVATLFARDLRVTTNIQKPDGTRAVGTQLKPGAAYDAVIRRSETYRGSNNILGRNYLTIYKPLRDAAGLQIGVLFVGAPLAATEAALADLRWKGLIGTAVVAVLVAALLWGLTHASLKPLGALAHAMRSVADGNLDTPVAATARRDAVGDMARALLGFIDSLRTAAQMQNQAEDLRAQQQEQRTRALREMAEAVEQQTAEAVDDVAGQMETLVSQVLTMTASSEKIAVDSTAVASAADLAQQNVQAVASATEELGASIREITGQITGTSVNTRRAAVRGIEGREAIAELSKEVSRIGGVARLIADIAGQTNLLALNATIEAARAGEAGKGFAVVASEVKQLAAQTAKATDDIARQVQQVAEATDRAVNVVREMADAVSEVDQAAAAIAAAMEEQAAATQEIARAVAETSSAANDVSSRIGRISHETTNARKHSAEVMSNSVTVRAAVVELRASVVKALRQSAPEVERRKHPRLPLTLAARLSGDTLDAAGLAVTVQNISLGGCQLEQSVPGLKAGSRYTFRCDTLAPGLILPLELNTIEPQPRCRFLPTEAAMQQRFEAALSKLEPTAFQAA